MCSLRRLSIRAEAWQVVGATRHQLPEADPAAIVRVVENAVDHGGRERHQELPARQLIGSKMHLAPSADLHGRCPGPAELACQPGDGLLVDRLCRGTASRRSCRAKSTSRRWSAGSAEHSAKEPRSRRRTPRRRSPAPRQARTSGTPPAGSRPFRTCEPAGGSRQSGPRGLAETGPRQRAAHAGERRRDGRRPEPIRVPAAGAARSIGQISDPAPFARAGAGPYWRASPPPAWTLPRGVEEL